MSDIFAQASEALLGENSRDSTLKLLERFAQAEIPGFGWQTISLRRELLASARNREVCVVMLIRRLGEGKVFWTRCILA